MSIIGQRNIVCTIDKNEDVVYAKAIILSKEFEASAWLAVGASDYLIQEADWEISKAPENTSLGRGIVSDVIGVKANTGIGSALVHLTKSNGGVMIKSLIFECVKGLMQAETYLYQERGYADEAAYEAYWMDKESNGCRFYTHPASDKYGWFDHVGPYQRTGNLFNRCKSYQLSAHGTEQTLQGTFHDSYHEMAGELKFDKATGIISECNLSMFRAPGSSCLETTAHGRSFVGENIYSLTRKQVVGLVGGPHGCYHLTDLLADMLPLITEHNLGRSDTMNGGN
jgi:Protein of unknown function (DUF2889)